jgi:hypothetical protein
MSKIKLNIGTRLFKKLTVICRFIYFSTFVFSTKYGFHFDFLSKRNRIHNLPFSCQFFLSHETDRISQNQKKFQIYFFSLDRLCQSLLKMSYLIKYRMVDFLRATNCNQNF